MNTQILASKFYDHSLYIRGYAKPTIKRYRQAINFYSKFAGITNLEQVSNDNVRNFFFYGRTERN